MKKIFLALLSFAFISLQAQKVEEIIQKHTDAVGGLDSFNKVTTIRMTGIATVQGNDIPFTTEIINGKAMKLVATFMDQELINCYANDAAWKINPFAGITTATEVTGSELLDFKAQASLADNLMDYKNRGHKVELIGDEVVEGVKTFKIKLTAKEDGRTTTYFVNSTDYFLAKSISTREIQGQETEVETTYSEIREIGGLKFSMSRSQKMGGQEFQSITMADIELNVAVDEKIFQK